MKLEFLGNGSAFHAEAMNTSAFCRYEDALILFDCGETVFKSILSRGLLDGVRSVTVIITHLHADHSGSLGSFISYCYCRRKLCVHVVFPNDEVKHFLQITGVDDFMYTCSDAFPAELAEKLNILPISVFHDPKISCFGYLCSFGNDRFYYGGDTAEVPSQILDLLFSSKLSNVYLDVTYPDFDGYTTHGTLKNLEKLIPAQYRQKVTCMHLDSSSFIPQLLAAGFHVAGCSEPE